MVHRGLTWGALLLAAGCKELNRPLLGAQHLADRYPCDQGIAGDPAVVWAENFEEGSVSAVTSRYNSSSNVAGLSLVTDKPSGSCGAASMRFTADGRNAATQATDLYKRFDAGQDELYVRWYAKYEAGAPWHHTGVWFGGYNRPATGRTRKRESDRSETTGSPSQWSRCGVAGVPIRSSISTTTG